MRTLVTVVRVLAVFVLILTFLTHMSIVWLFIRRHWARVRWSNSLLARYARVASAILNLKTNAIGLENLKNIKGGLFVGNHLSYMDVIGIAGVIPTCFVTSTEIKESFGLGQICQMAGCLFVNRKNKSNIHKEISELREGLQLGLKVAIFPEATSTNGEAILRFRKPLFVAAIDGGVPVFPFVLNYRKVGGKPISTANRDKICWYGNMDFMPHLWALAGSGGIELDLHFLPPTATTLETDATDLAERSQRAVESAFKPIRPLAEQPHDVQPLQI